MPVFKGFSLSDFTNKYDFNIKINGKGEPSGYVLTTDGVQSYWQPGGGGGTGYQGVQGIQGPAGGGGGTSKQGIQGIQGINGFQGYFGVQGIQGPSGGGSGGSEIFYYANYYEDINVSNPLDLNLGNDLNDWCTVEYQDQFDNGSSGVHLISNIRYRESTLTPVTTSIETNALVVDERSPFSFGTCYTDHYATEGILIVDETEIQLDYDAGIPALYWKPNSLSRSYTYYKDGETAYGPGGLGRYFTDGGPIRNMCIDHDTLGGYPFVFGIDLDWLLDDKGSGYGFKRASQTDHYFLFDNQDGTGGDAVDFICMKIFIKNVIQVPSDMQSMPHYTPYNFIMDPFKNIRFNAMDNGFVIPRQKQALLHLCIRKFPNLEPSYDGTISDWYHELGGNPEEERNDSDCDTYIASLDWVNYNGIIAELSDTKNGSATFDTITHGGFYLNNRFYYIE